MALAAAALADKMVAPLEAAAASAYLVKVVMELGLALEAPAALVQPQELAALTAAAVEVLILPAVRALLERFVLSGPVTLVHSHLQTLEIFNRE